MTINYPFKIATDIRNPKVLKVNAGKVLSWLQIILIALIDSLAIALAWTIALKIGTSVNSYFLWKPNQEELGFLWLIIPINLCIMTASGIYGTEERGRSYTNLFKAICLAQITILLIVFLLQPGIWISPSAFMLAWALTLILVSSEKVLLAMVITNVKRTFISFRRKVLLLGTLEDTIKAKELIDLTKTFKIQAIADLSILLLVILALPMLFIAMVIKLDSNGSVFYKQNRVGLKGCHFRVWKFRTMVKNANELQPALEVKNEVAGGILFKIKEDPRITKVGRFIRRYSLDELPQLINVLLGEMSLVGPRPLPLRDVAKLAPAQLLRHEVLPGITGLWQVSGRSDSNSEEIFNLDFTYIQNWSLILDLQILLKTIQVVISSKGAY
jgi:lipopolysaccharide/colanic/teichoic acid biosynthesis glycosyltransferase